MGSIKRKKKIVFFDGDGTLWYPKKTKHSDKSHWIYSLPGTHKDHCHHLMLTPTTVATLKKLKRMGIITIILSAHPQDKKLAYEIINHKIKHFKLAGLFDEVHPTRTDEAEKGRVVLKLLKKYNLPKKSALMVGDNYTWDYKSVRSVGVDALLIKAEHHLKNHPGARRVRRVIDQLKDVLDYV
jgi:phosphoglycolate phosphatase-like HAD superfamily hydrolase